MSGQMSLDEAHATRDAIARVEEHAGPGWLERAYRAVVVCAERLPEFSVNDVWDVLGDDTAGENRALGSVMVRARCDGLIEATDRNEPSTREGNHGCPRRIWRSLVIEREERTCQSYG